MVIIFDSREVRPLRFPLTQTVTEVRKEAMKVGDYWCEFSDGSRPPVIVERKSKSDLWKTLTFDYDRFRREILLAQHLGVKLILAVECSMTEVYAGHEFSQVEGKSMVQKMFTMYAKYSVLPVFCQDRDEMVAWIVELYTSIGRSWKAKKSVPLGQLFGGALQAPLDLSGGVAGED